MSLWRVILPLIVCALFVGCDNRTETEKREAARASDARVSAKEAARNQCDADADCMVTGCRGTLCRAAVDQRFCAHRLVLGIHGAPDRPALLEGIRQFVGGPLLPLERESLQIGDMGDSVIVSFHAPISKRESLVETLSGLESGGVFAVHAASDAFVDRAMAREDVVSGGITVVTRDDGIRLLEQVILAGDIVNRTEVDAVSAQLGDMLQVSVPEGALLAFEPVLDPHRPVVRAWLLDPVGSIGFGNLGDLSIAADGDVQVVDGQFDADGTQALAALTEARTGLPIVFAMGRDVLATPRVSAPIDDGAFHLRLLGVGGDTAIVERIERIRAAPLLAAHLTFLPERTAVTEADNACLTAAPPLAPCGCVEGMCQWTETPALDACLNGVPPE